MTRLSKLLVAAAVTVAIPAQTVLADSHMEADPDAVPVDDPNADPTADPTADPNAMPADPMADPNAAPAVTGAYPKERVLRPPTLPKGMLQATGSLDIARLSVTILGMTSSATNVGLRAGAGYGVSDKLEVGGSYGVRLYDGFEAKGPLRLYGMFGVADDAKMKIAAGGSFTYDLLGETANIGLGAYFQYAINEKLIVYTPGDQLSITAVSPDVAGMSSPKPITLGLPVAAGYQATPELFAFLWLNPINISISDSSNTFFDPLGVALGALYAASEKMDIFASLTFPSIADAGDIMAISAGANFRM
jgi:hypothetical protein